MEKFNVGIIGCGSISSTYAKAGNRFDAIRIAACADLDIARARELAGREGIPKALTPHDLLADPEIQIVLNLTVPAAHAGVALDAVRTGKHVYNEKPLAVRRREAREFLGLAGEKGLRVGCAPDTFLGAGLQTCRRLIDAGAIGKPLAATAFMMGRGVESWHPNPGFFYKKGGGPLFDMGPYYLTALTTLLGPVARVAGSAAIGIPIREITSEPLAGQRIPVETPTHIAAVLDFASGTVASFTMSFEVCAHRCPRLEIYGEEATLAVPDPNTFGGPVELRRMGSNEWEEVPLAFPYADDSRGLGLADMAEAILEDREHRANARVAYHVLDVMHSILDSSQAGRHIELRSAMTRPQPFPDHLIPGRAG